MLLPFSVLFFGFSYVVLRHHVYYLWKTERDGMGKMWPWLMACVVVIIVASCIVFNTPMSFIGGVGSGIAVLGTLLYSLAKKKYTKK